MGGYQAKDNRGEGTNHPGGVLVNFYLREEPDSTVKVKLEFFDQRDSLVRSFSSSAEMDKDKLKVKKGFNQFGWDMRYPDAKSLEGLILWASDLSGPRALPGQYRVRLVYGEDSLSREFSILKDPRSETTAEELRAQFDFLMETSDKFSQTSEVINDIREARKQLEFLKSKLGDEDKYRRLVEMTDSVGSSIKGVEETLYQTRNQSGQDPLNFPIRLNNKLAHLMTLTSIGDYQPTEQALKFKNEVFVEIDAAITEFDRIKTVLIPELNRLVREAAIDAVVMD
jgi:hypothetical protein